jgi:KDO2-lipid IV(A) lauroyltransferase
MSGGPRNIRHRIEWLALEAAVRSVPLLPRRGCMAVAGVLGTLFHRLDRHGRRVAHANLEAVFGDRFGAAERDRIARLSVCNFARTFLDLFWGARHIRANNFRRWFEIPGASSKERADAVPGSTLFVCQHFGNWEWLAYQGVLDGIRLRTVAQEFRNPRIGPVFDRIRTAHGGEVIARSGGMVKLVRFLKEGGSVAMLTDLTLRPEMPSVVLDCFGMKVCMTRMHVAFHRRIGCQLVPAAGIPLPDGRLRMEIGEAIESAPGATDRDIAQACWDIAERRIRERPDLWLWSYKHFRYRPKSGGERYPFYANVSGAFERRLREPDGD